MNNSIVLRALEPEDLDLLYHVENDQSLWRVGITNVPYSRYVLHDYMSSTTGDIYTDKQVRLVIEREADHVTIGMADLTSFDPKHRKAEVSIVIVSPHRRKGYGKNALASLHDYARHTLHLHQVYAVVAVDNDASVSLFRSMGYNDSAQLKDWLFDGQGYQDALVMQYTL